MTTGSKLGTTMGMTFGGDASGEIRVGNMVLKFAVSSLELNTEIKEIGGGGQFPDFLVRGRQTVKLTGVLLENIPDAEVEIVKQSLLEAARRKFRNI